MNYLPAHARTRSLSAATARANSSHASQDQSAAAELRIPLLLMKLYTSTPEGGCSTGCGPNSNYQSRPKWSSIGVACRLLVRQRIRARLLVPDRRKQLFCWHFCKPRRGWVTHGYRYRGILTYFRGIRNPSAGTASAGPRRSALGAARRPRPTSAASLLAIPPATAASA